MVSGCARACLAIIGAVAFLLLALAAQRAYDDEDSPLNGAIIGMTTQIRVRIALNGVVASEGHMVLVSRLSGLIRLASKDFAADIDRFYTRRSGAAVSELWVASAGRYCLFDGTRCIHDGSTLVAVRRGEALVPLPRRKT